MNGKQAKRLRALAFEMTQVSEPFPPRRLYLISPGNPAIAEPPIVGVKTQAHNPLTFRWCLKQVKKTFRRTK